MGKIGEGSIAGGGRTVTKLYVLRLGEVCLDQHAIAPGVADGSRIHLPILGYLVERHKSEYVLIDTGMNQSHINSDLLGPVHGRPRASARVQDMVIRMRIEDYLPNQLASIGLKVEDINHVINTHLHFDHAGNNILFPHATFYVQREHYALALGSDTFPNEYWNQPNFKFELIDGDCQLFPGIKVIQSPGHVAGHQSILVELEKSGIKMICGDAIFNSVQLASGVWTSHANPVEAQRSSERLIKVAKGLGAELFFGHDPIQGANLLKLPLFYE